MDIKMKPGTYYIGDPSYITKGNPGYQWIEKLWDEFYSDQIAAKKVNIEGVDLFIGQTAGGDGAFNGIYVDSGVITVLRINDLREDQRFDFNKTKGVKFLNFSHCFTTNYNNGIFNIGNELIIRTE